MENKAMNEELKSADEILGKNTGMTFDEETYLIQTHFEYVIKAMEEYASQFQKQLKEKEEEIRKLNSESVPIEDYEFVKNLIGQLTKSNEMNERLAESLYSFLNVLEWRKENDIENWDNSDGDKLNEVSQVLTEYQNSKK